MPIPVTDGLGAVDVQYKEYGVILEVRPRAESNGGIYAEVDVELSQVDSSVRVRDYPGFVKRRTSTAINARPTANPDPLSVCSGSGLPVAGFLQRACMRRAWYDSKLLHEEISRYRCCPGNHTSRSTVLAAARR